MQIECLSIELTNRCNKACAFCYNRSQPTGQTLWTPEELLDLIGDCVRNGTKSVSFGGGEPLLYPGLHEILEATYGQLFRSVTTNGLLLTCENNFARLVAASPDKVHVSIHQPDSQGEVDRVISSVLKLEGAGIVSGVNLLVSADRLEAATRAAKKLKEARIDNRRVIYIPHRFANTPTPKEVARVAAGPFQSPSCLTACGKSPRFCTISWDRAVSRCSYTAARRPLTDLTYAGLAKALDGLDVVDCNVLSRMGDS